MSVFNQWSPEGVSGIRTVAVGADDLRFASSFCDLPAAHRCRTHARARDGRGEKDFDSSGTPHCICRRRDAAFLSHPHAEIR